MTFYKFVLLLFNITDLPVLYIYNITNLFPFIYGHEKTGGYFTLNTPQNIIFNGKSYDERFCEITQKKIFTTKYILIIFVILKYRLKLIPVR